MHGGPPEDKEQSEDPLVDAINGLADLFRRRLYEDKIRTRALDELQEQLRFARAGLTAEFVLPMVRELLLIVDRFGTSGQADDALAASLVEELLEVLYRRGLQVVGTDGVFDPSVHEAVAVECDHDAVPGNVSSVRRPGYTMNGQLVRPAQVTVVDECEPHHALHS